MPRVSVLTPVYNAEKYIGDAIGSILSQTFTDFEFIIINDGSTDNTAKIVRKYAAQDKRIKFIDSKKNLGVSAVRNKLLDFARGEYIAYQDADDISVPNRLETQVKFLDENPDVTVVGGAMLAFPRPELIVVPKNPKIMDFCIANAVSNPTVMFRRADVMAIGLRYNPALRTAEDYDFWVRLVKHYNIHNLPNILVNYRVSGTSLSHNNPEMDKVNAKIRSEIINFLTGDDKVKNILKFKQRISLFGFLPLFKIKYNHIYLFDFIPVLSYRGKYWWLFDIIPLFTKG